MKESSGKRMLHLIGICLMFVMLWRCTTNYAVRDSRAGYERDEDAISKQIRDSQPDRPKYKYLPRPYFKRKPKPEPVIKKQPKPKSIPVKKQPKRPEKVKPGSTSAKSLSTVYGKASYYGGKFHGRQTANGEIYNKYEMTAAHKTLPFGTVCRVTNLANGKQVKVRINDRGPFIKGRIIDLSYRACQVLDGIAAGVVNVKLEVLAFGKK